MSGPTSFAAWRRQGTANNGVREHWKGQAEMGRMLPITLVRKLFLVSTACSALAEGYEMVFPSSHSHRTLDFSIQKTLLDTNPSGCGCAGSIKGPWSTGWAGPALRFQIPFHLQSPLTVLAAFPQTSPYPLPLTQPHSSDE